MRGAATIGIAAAARGLAGLPVHAEPNTSAWIAGQGLESDGQFDLALEGT